MYVPGPARTLHAFLKIYFVQELMRQGTGEAYILNVLGLSSDSKALHPVPRISSRSVKFCLYCHPKPPRWLSGKEPVCQCKNEGSILGLGRSPGEAKGYLLQYSGLENSMDCIVHGVAKSWTRLSDIHFHFQWLIRPRLFSFVPSSC